MAEKQTEQSSSRLLGDSKKITKKPTKQVKIKHHHVKRYRKRHLSSLGIFIIIGVVLIMFSLQYRAQVNRALDSAEDYINSVFNRDPINQRQISSSYGFDVTYDARSFYAGGLDSASGNLFIGSELSTIRAYEQIRFSPSLYLDQSNNTSMTITYDKNTAAADYKDPALAALETLLLQKDIDSSATELQKIDSNVVVLGGQSFQKNVWQFSAKNGAFSKLKITSTVYLGTLNGKAFIIRTNNGTGSGTLYDEVVASLNFGKATTSLLITSQSGTVEKLEKNRSLLDTILFTQLASAQTSNVDSSERTTSLYSPAVVKIYNVYCMDILLSGRPYLRDVCDGGTGSGFFVSADGYIATNGHVAATSVKDIVILGAVYDAAAGRTQYLAELLDLANVSESEFSSIADDNEYIARLIDALYERLPDNLFTTTNSVSNLLVGLNEAQPNLEELLNLTKNRQEYLGQDSIKRAKLIAADYRVLDGIDGFKASDVALIKIDGSNFPVTKLGDATSLTQGGQLAILGYPGNASDNGLVESDQSRVTLTTGTVSAIKNAAGSDKVLIETDTTIGHGNSGGPAFNTSGEVIGLATYTSDGGGKGDGTFNYIRDIKDFKDLVTSKSIQLDIASETQEEWEKGITNFYNARYSKAVKNFEKVSDLYGQHPKAAEFIATSQQRIQNGEDVKDFPILLVVGGVLVVLIGAGVTSGLIYRQHRGHRAYAGHVAAGNIPPMTSKDPAQHVPYVPVGTPVQPTVVPQQTPPATTPQAQQPVPIPTPPPTQQATIVKPTNHDITPPTARVM